MIIKCKSCRCENPIGSIFCRDCGTKLDMEYLDKSIRKNLKTKKILHFCRGILRFIVVLLLITAIYGAYLIFEPARYFSPVQSVLVKEQEALAMALYDKIEMGIPGTYNFTDEQLSYLAMSFFPRRGNTIIVTFPDNKHLGFTIGKHLLTYASVKLDIRVTAVCELIFHKNTKGRDVLNATFKYLKIGKLKLPAWYNQLFIDDFKPYMSNRKLTVLLEKVDSIKIEDSQIEVTLY